MLGSVVNTWGKSNGSFNYTNVYPYDQVHLNDVGGAASTATSSMPSTTGTSSATGTSSSSPSSSAKSAGSVLKSGGVVSIVVAFAALVLMS